MMARSVVPVVLFAYARPDHLRRTLDGLRANEIPLLYAFSDGPSSADSKPMVSQVREILRGIDWCETVICEREENLGLGRSIRRGVTEILERFGSIIVVEDDLLCVPGTYRYLVAALHHYRDDPQVMSVTGWTHPDVCPSTVTNLPYFDGRAECWVWGTWARAWKGMDRDALSLLGQCEARGIDIYRYGADLPEMARVELERNIWAVRFLYLHILHGGLCVRPPHTMVEHAGVDEFATNARDPGPWSALPLQDAPPIPQQWPSPEEHPECPLLWQKIYGSGASIARRGRIGYRLVLKARAVVRRLSALVQDEPA